MSHKMTVNRNIRDFFIGFSVALLSEYVTLHIDTKLLFCQHVKGWLILSPEWQSFIATKHGLSVLWVDYVALHLMVCLDSSCVCLKSNCLCLQQKKAAVCKLEERKKKMNFMFREIIKMLFQRKCKDIDFASSHDGHRRYKKNPYGSKVCQE